jgi:hypothetical protein
MPMTTFPYYVSPEDQPRMTMLCSEELESWRRAKAYHYSIRPLNKRLEARPMYEVVADELRMAWEAATGSKIKAA